MRRLKKIGLFVVAECFKALFRLLMFALVVYGAGKIISYETKEKPVEESTYIELKLADEVTESRIKTPFNIKKEMNFFGLLKNIEKAEKDSRVEGIILRLDDVALNRAQIEEFSDKIKEFRASGKKVYAYAPTFDNNTYLVASSADKIIMPPTAGAMSDIKGYFIEIPYYKALGEKLGVKMNIIHIGDYKSAGENFEKYSMSKEFRENYSKIYDNVYENFVSSVAENRKIDRNILNERILEGDLVLSDPETLKRFGLIDEAKYYEEFLSENNMKNIIGIKEYISKLTADKKPKDEKKSYSKIAVIYAEGTITYFEDDKKFDESVTPERIQKELAIAEKDPDIKGVVIRVNSPGGSALASDIIYNSIKNLTKPVYISMGGVAASGGYYISAAGEKIYADRETLTGSIGVVMMFPDISELMKKVDINNESISKGKYADLGNINRSLTLDERDKLYGSSLKVYNEFVDRVAEGRKMSREDVLKAAEGRVWLGQEAVKMGLVDEIGGIEKAVSDMAEFLQLEDYKTVESLKEEKIESVIKNYLPKYLMAQVIGDKIYETVKSTGVLSEELMCKPVLYAPNTDIK